MRSAAAQRSAARARPDDVHHRRALHRHQGSPRVEVCPVDCIYEFERMLIIDPEECIDCGACEPECPVEAIFPDDALPDKWDPFVKINYAFRRVLRVIDPLVQQYADENNVQNEPIPVSRAEIGESRSPGLIPALSGAPKAPVLRGRAASLVGFAGAQPLGRRRSARASAGRRRLRGVALRLCRASARTSSGVRAAAGGRGRPPPGPGRPRGLSTRRGPSGRRLERPSSASVSAGRADGRPAAGCCPERVIGTPEARRSRGVTGAWGADVRHEWGRR